MVIDIPDNTTEVYTVDELQPAIYYRLTVLAYTSVGDGPRSIQLTVPTLSKNLSTYHVKNYMVYHSGMSQSVSMIIM